MLNLIISRHVGTHWRHRTLKIGQCAWMGPRGWEGSFGMLAHNATRVVICPRWVITNLRPSPFPWRGLIHRGTQASREKARPVDLIVNRGRQNMRAREPARALFGSGNFGKEQKKDAGVKRIGQESGTVDRYTWHEPASTMASLRSISVKWTQRLWHTDELQCVQLRWSWNFWVVRGG